MSAYELIGNDVDRWQAHVQGYFTTNQEAFGERLDEQQASLNAQGCYLAFGNEVEFRLQPNRPEGTAPEVDGFYQDVVGALCGDELPRIEYKGSVFDPRDTSAPIFLNQPRDGTFHHENGGDPNQKNSQRVMELHTYPAADWREADRRLWNAIGTAGSLAARYDCKIEVATQETTSINWVQGDEWEEENNFTGSGKPLLAMQGARTMMLPFEPWMSLMPSRYETAPWKAALWGLRALVTETRFPLFGLHDTRLGKLAAYAGVQRLLADKPHFGSGKLHRCYSMHFDGMVLPELDTLSGIMAWDSTVKKMVLPRNMSRSSIAAAGGRSAPFRLDQLVYNLGGAAGEDFSMDDARFLREAADELMIGYAYERPVTYRPSKFRSVWNLLFANTTMRTKLAARIVEENPVTDRLPWVEARNRAMQSPEVAEILGSKLLKSLTPPAQAHAMREEILKNKR